MHNTCIYFLLNNSAALVTGTCKSFVIIIFLLSILYFACSIRDVPVERNPQYYILSLYCIFRIKLNSTQLKIADTETNYLDEVRDRAIPMIHELIKISEHVLHRDSPPIPISPAPTAQMQKLKFPTFFGDNRDYKRFRELFIHFANHLTPTECLYQLVECMQRPAERNKIKPCTNYHRAW